MGVGHQTAPNGLLHQDLGRGTVTDHHRIAAQQLSGIAPQPRLHAVGQKTHRGQRGHRQRHRKHQQAQLARAQIAPQLPAAQAQALHPSWCVHALTLPQMGCPCGLWFLPGGALGG